MKKIIIPALGVCIHVFQNPAQAAAYWMVKAEWHFPALDTSKVYQGRGLSREQALRDARNRCIVHQTGPWAAYCGTASARVDYTEVEDWGTLWSGWKEMHRGVGNPCPPDCFRGARITRQMRSGGQPPVPQQRELVECRRKR